MSQREDIQQAVNSLVRSLRRVEEIAAIWFYGAAQRDRTWEESDVDLLILTETEPVARETRAERSEVTVHLHWIGREAFLAGTGPGGNLQLQRDVAGGELVYDRDDEFGPLVKRLRSFSSEYRVYHMMPHLNALLWWARDLRKRMALGDERPRRAAARQWEVDNHAASVLLVEAGIFPHNEATMQALEARLFVPNMAAPEEIEAFVRPRIEKWLLPQLRTWAEEGDFDEALLRQRYGAGPAALLLEFAADDGMLKRVRTTGRSGFPIKELLFRPA